MTFSRRIFLPGALIALPVIFVVGSIALAQAPGSPKLPQESVVIELGTPSSTPTPVPSMTSEPAAPPAPAPAPAPPAPAPPAPPADDDDGEGDDD